MYKEPKIMQKIHKIRKEHYERTKGWNPQKVMQEVELRANKTIKELGLCIIQHETALRSETK